MDFALLLQDKWGLKFNFVNLQKIGRIFMVNFLYFNKLLKDSSTVGFGFKVKEDPGL